MAGCERAREWKKALELLKRAEAAGLKPDVITYNTGEAMPAVGAAAAAAAAVPELSRASNAVFSCVRVRRNENFRPCPQYARVLPFRKS
jgi:pentatricopeptide repeat protein